MKLLYELPELPEGAWHTTFEPTSERDLQPWLDEQLARAGDRVRRRATHPVETARGWAAELVTFEVAGSFGVPSTYTIVIAYQFLDLRAAICVAGVPVPWLADHELELVAMLRAVEPDWIHEAPLALIELWTDAVS